MPHHNLTGTGQQDASDSRLARGLQHVVDADNIVRQNLLHEGLIKGCRAEMDDHLHPVNRTVDRAAISEVSHHRVVHLLGRTPIEPSHPVTSRG